MAALFLKGLLVIFILVTLLWLYSVKIKNVSIIDIFWGMGFVIVNAIYGYYSGEYTERQLLLLILVSIWGIRLSAYLGWRNWGQPEDYRYQQFRQDYGPERYWWFSYFQVFLLQGGLVLIVSLPLLAVHANPSAGLNLLDYFGIGIWCIGFLFEAGGDYQLAKFKANPENKGKVLDHGFWKYTRHPNYFGDATVWIAYALFCVASESYWPVIGPIIMILLIIKVSGVAMLERTLKDTKPQYKEYIRKTSAFIPWFPKK